MKYLPRSPRGESEGRELDIALIPCNIKAGASDLELGASDLELGASDLELGASGLAGLPLESHVMDIWGWNFNPPSRKSSRGAPEPANGLHNSNVSEQLENSKGVLDFIFQLDHAFCGFGENFFDFGSLSDQGPSGGGSQPAPRAPPRSGL